MIMCVTEADGHVCIRMLRLSCFVSVHSHYSSIQSYHAQTQCTRPWQVSS